MLRGTESPSGEFCPLPTLTRPAPGRTPRPAARETALETLPGIRLLCSWGKTGTSPFEGGKAPPGGPGRPSRPLENPLVKLSGAPEGRKKRPQYLEETTTTEDYEEEKSL